MEIKASVDLSLFLVVMLSRESCLRSVRVIIIKLTPSKSILRFFGIDLAEGSAVAPYRARHPGGTRVSIDSTPAWKEKMKSHFKSIIKKNLYKRHRMPVTKLRKATQPRPHVRNAQYWT
jgi:hypothetical protein